MAPAIEGRDDGAPGVRLGPQSNDARAEGNLLEVRCADVALGLVFAPGRTRLVKVQPGLATLSMTHVVVERLVRATASS